MYAPTADSTEGNIDKFYRDLTLTVKEVKKNDVLIIGGDWNAKIGTDNTGWETIMGKFGYGDRNERGERLMEFAMDNELVICNSKFQHKECHKWTWRSPDGKTKNMIDLILINKKWITSVQQCRSFQGADVNSDHSLVIANIKIKLKRKYKAQSQKRRDVSRLAEEEIKNAYVGALEAKLRAIDKNQSIDEKAARLTTAMTEAVQETIPEQEKINKKWITPETLKLVQEKRILKVNRDVSETADRLYRAKCNEVRKAARADKAKWLEDQCRNIEQYYGEYKSREVYKLIKNLNRKWQPRLASIKDENGTVLMEKKDIVERWTRYCSDLYTEQLDQNITMQVVKELQAISPLNEDHDDTILEGEVRRAIQRLKNNKSPGNDGITGEMIKHGGDIIIQEMHQLCNAIWKEGRTPAEWKKSILVVLHKKGSALECNNYRTIALMSHLGKVLMTVLTERLRSQTEEHLSDEQAGFRKDRSTVQQILALRLIAEKLGGKIKQFTIVS